MDAFFIYVPYGPPANPSAKGLEYPRMAKVVSRIVWNFRAWRKSFPKWFGVSVHGESCFPNGLEFPCLAKVISQMVWRLRASRKLLFKGFDACGPPANHFLKVLVLASFPQIFPQKVCYFCTWRKSFLESWMVMYLVMEEGVVILVEFYGKEMFLNLSH